MNNKSIFGSTSTVRSCLFRLLWIGVFAAHSALAAGPYAFTQSARFITATNAVLNGAATPNGLPSSAWFEWGSSITYGHQTAPIDVGTGNSIIWVTNQVTDLIPGTDYHFRLVVSNSMGTAFGADSVFAYGKRVRTWGTNSTGLTNSRTGGIKDVVAIAVGSDHCLALTARGGCLAWGNSSATLSAPENLDNVAAVACGGMHSMALTANGSVVSWGENSSGQTNVPPGLIDVVAIAGGGSHSLALKIDGNVVAWGKNDYGQTNVPAGLSNVVAISAGGNHNLALRNDGTVVGWGNDSYGQASVPTGLSNVAGLAAGQTHSLVLHADGTVSAWGRNDFNQANVPAGLSNVIAIAAVDRSFAIRNDGSLVVWGAPLFPSISELTNVIAIAASQGRMLVLAEDRPPTASSQIVNGPMSTDFVIALSGSDPDADSLKFRLADLPTQGFVYQYTNGIRGAQIDSTNIMVRDSFGRVIFSAEPGGYGNPYTTFQVVAHDGTRESLPATVSVHVGAPFATTKPARMVTANSAVLNGMATANGMESTAWFEWGPTSAYGNQTSEIPIGDGNAVTWVTNQITGLTPGIDYHFRLAVSNSMGIAYGGERVFGFGKRVRRWGAIRGPVSPGHSFVAIDANSFLNLALTSEGNVLVWGVQGSVTNVPPSATNIVAIAAGGSHALALRSDGTVVAWGDSTCGQTNVPVGLTDVVEISAGDSHSLALKKDGKVVAWGNNIFGISTIPPGLSNVISIAARENYNFALRNDGSVFNWGPLVAFSPIPVLVSSADAIKTGDAHMLLLKKDGTVTSWSDSQWATPPTGLDDVVDIATGSMHSLALKSNGEVVAWGYTSMSQNATQVPAGLANVVSVAAGDRSSLALAPNSMPAAISQVISCNPNRDVVIALSATDLDADNLTFKITRLPESGVLYQCVNGARGAVINENDTLVADPSGRVIFSPIPNTEGVPYTTFGFVANDSFADSAPANITVDVFKVAFDRCNLAGDKTSFHVGFAGLSNRTYSIWISSDLKNWTRIGNATQTTPGNFEYQDYSPQWSSRRFYQLTVP